MNDTLLTYEQWCARFKKHTKRYIKKKVMQILQYLFAAVLNDRFAAFSLPQVYLFSENSATF